MSIKDAQQVLSGITNVSTGTFHMHCMFCIYYIQCIYTGLIHPSRRSFPLFTNTGRQQLQSCTEKSCKLCKKNLTYAKNMQTYGGWKPRQYAVPAICKKNATISKISQKICNIRSLCKPWHQYARYARGTLLMAAECRRAGAAIPPARTLIDDELSRTPHPQPVVP